MIKPDFKYPILLFYIHRMEAYREENREKRNEKARIKYHEKKE